MAASPGCCYLCCEILATGGTSLPADVSLLSLAELPGIFPVVSGLVEHLVEGIPGVEPGRG